MRFQPCRRHVAGLISGLAVALWATGCSSVDSASNRVASLITPYRVEIIQGNFISREQASGLRVGMDRAQVKDLLGTPLMASVFHDNRWDYVFTLRRDGAKDQQRRLTVFFSGNEVQRVEGAEDLPSEAEFVAAIDSKRKFGKAPPLEATDEQLKNFKPASAASAPSADAAADTGNRSYPPLESGVRR